MYNLFEDSNQLSLFLIFEVITYFTLYTAFYSELSILEFENMNRNGRVRSEKAKLAKLLNIYRKKKKTFSQYVNTTAYNLQLL